MVKNLPANAGDTGSVPGLGRSHLPRGSSACAPQLLKPVHPTARAPQEKPLQWEATHTSKSRPRSLQLEKSPCNNNDTAQTKLNKKNSLKKFCTTKRVLRILSAGCISGKTNKQLKAVGIPLVKAYDQTERILETFSHN